MCCQVPCHTSAASLNAKFFHRVQILPLSNNWYSSLCTYCNTGWTSLCRCAECSKLSLAQTSYRLPTKGKKLALTQFPFQRKMLRHSDLKNSSEYILLSSKLNHTLLLESTKISFIFPRVKLWSRILWQWIVACKHVFSSPQFYRHSTWSP